MSFWEDLKLALIGAESPSTSYQMYDLKRKAEERELKEKELELANNPAGKNIVIPANYLRLSKEGLADGNIVDDYIMDKYDSRITSRENLMPNTNVVINPVSGHSSGMGRIYWDVDNGTLEINDYTTSTQLKPYKDYKYFYKGHNFVVPLDHYYTQPEVLLEPVKESANNRRAAYNQARGTTSAEAYKRQKELREAGYDITYDGYWGDASAAAWEDYMQTKAANMTPSLAVDPSVTKPVTTTKPTDPSSPIATAKMPAQFANVDIMGAIKAEEARKKAELEALMQKQGAGSELLNTDPHNIKGGYVAPKEEPLDYSKLQTHTTDTNPFGFITANPLRDASKFYLKGGEMKEKETPTSFYSSGYFIDENGNPVTQETEMVKGNYNGKQYNIQRNIINTNSKSDTIMYNNNKRIPLENPDSAALYNEIFRDLLMRAQPVGEYKKGGSLKKCSCGCKTLLKRGKGGKVMESKNCK